MRHVFILSLLCAGSYAQLNPSPVSKDLDKNNVKAKIMTANDKFWNKYGNTRAAYEVPKGKGTHATFANSIWIGGLDAGGQLHLAANTYKQLGADFWSGPLDTTNIAAFSASNSAIYNKLWKVDCTDIDNFVTAFNSGAVAANTYTIPDGILTYPAKGTANFQRNMMPFVDVNNNGLYNPLSDGDYPVIKGHQQILSVFNDKNGNHNESQALPMGIEIYERSYAYSEPNIIDTMHAVNNATFYHYTIYNRSGTNYNNVYITDWSDVDLGNWMDDFVGTDVTNSFAYCYNGNPLDPNIGNTVVGYGNKPPVISHMILKTDCTNDGVDNNNNTQIDEPGECFLLNGTTYYNNNVNTVPPPTTNPSIAGDFYNYMKGIWKDGSPFTAGGTAYGGTTTTQYVYTGDPANNTGWTESTVGNTPGDRRILLSSGPFNFPANTKIEWGFALIFSQDTTPGVNTITGLNTLVKRDVRNTRYYDQMHQALQCAPQVNVGIKPAEPEKLSAMIYPNPASGFISIDLNGDVNSADVNIMDVFGRVVMQSKIIGTYRTIVALSALEPGIYFVEITTIHSKTTEKLIKN